MGTVAREFQLSDGSIWTARQLAFELGITQTACRCRLSKTNDIDEVMRIKHSLKSKPNKAYKCKEFELSDGSKMTAEQIAKKYNINKSTIYARLTQRGIRDVAVLSQRPRNTANKLSKGYVKMSSQPKAVRNMLLERNYFDPMSRLFLKMA